MKMRGDTGQIQRAEEQLDEIKKVQVRNLHKDTQPLIAICSGGCAYRDSGPCCSYGAGLGWVVQGDVNELNAKMDAIMEHLKISVPQQQMDR